MIFAQAVPMIRPAIAALSKGAFTFHVIFFIVFPSALLRIGAVEQGGKDMILRF